MKLILFIVILQIFNILCISLVYISLSRKTNAQHKKSSSCGNKETFGPYNDNYNDGIDIKTVKCADVICSKAFDVSANMTIHNTTDKDKTPNDENISMLLSKDGNISFKNTETNSITSEATMKITSNKGMNVETSNGDLSIKSSSIVLPSSTLSNIKIGSISLLDIMYPVGCIFTTTNQKFRPSTIFGGTWINIAEEKNFDNKGRTANGYRFLVATASNTGLQVGGSSYIGVSNLPRHYHGIDITTASSDATHKHPIKSEFDNYDYNTVAHDRNFNKFIDELLKSNINSIPLDTSAKYYNHNKRYYRTTYTEDNKAPHTHKVTGNTKNSGNGVAWWPPYYRVYYWKRTA